MNVIDLQLEVEGDRIIVSMPGTSFRATYLKSQDPRDQRQLVNPSQCQSTKKRLSSALGPAPSRFTAESECRATTGKGFFSWR